MLQRKLCSRHTGVNDGDAPVLEVQLMRTTAFTSVLWDVPLFEPRTNCILIDGRCGAQQEEAETTKGISQCPRHSVAASGYAVPCEKAHVEEAVRSMRRSACRKERVQEETIRLSLSPTTPSRSRALSV